MMFLFIDLKLKPTLCGPSDQVISRLNHVRKQTMRRQHLGFVVDAGSGSFSTTSSFNVFACADRLEDNVNKISVQ